MEEKVLPVAGGDWVATMPEMPFRVGRVVRSYWDDGTVLIDLVLYDTEGNRIGRESPREGGPARFEPAVTYDGLWRRIHPPRFPIRSKTTIGPANADGMGRVMVIHEVTDRSERTKVVKQRRPRPSGGRVNFDPEAEAQALRRSAQELRDAARKIPPDLQDPLLERAKILETEASQLLR